MEESLRSLSASKVDVNDVDDNEPIKPYNIHVASKYLELTRKKLELTRLPHEILLPGQDWALGTPKRDIEPLIDYWLEKYSWREREAHFNAAVPQYRTELSVGIDDDCSAGSSKLRLHFVHLQSNHNGAVPLLLLPPFPLTGLSLPLDQLLQPLVDPVDPSSTTAFHVVVPSLPGLGFSDAFSQLSSSSFSYLESTAAMMDMLMRRLGYDIYLCSATGSGLRGPSGIDYYLPSLLARRHSQTCIGVHMIEPLIGEPSVRGGVMHWLKYQVTRFFAAGWFGYTTTDWEALARTRVSSSRRRDNNYDLERQPLLKNGQTASMLGLLSFQSLLSPDQPNTLAYALCDSPVGLLSLVLAELRGQSPMHEFGKQEIIDMTQLAWLPGPEGALRFWNGASEEVSSGRFAGKMRQEKRSPTKVAVSTFMGGNHVTDSGKTYRPPAWVHGHHNLVATSRWHGNGGLIIWERPEVVIDGVRGLARTIRESNDVRWNFGSASRLHALDEKIITTDDHILEVGEQLGNADTEPDPDSPDTVILASAQELLLNQEEGSISHW